MSTQEQQEELEALKAIYDNEFSAIGSDPPCFMIKVTEVSVEGGLNLKITLTTGYPDELPIIEVPNRSQTMTNAQHKQLIDYLNKKGKENLGQAMVYLLVEELKDWIGTNYTDIPNEVSSENQEEDLNVNETFNVHLEKPQTTGGRWDLVIGLIGKPSAGKSTFFNAATALDLAKTGSHPFTTIEPNIGKGYYSVPCPCATIEKKCDAAYGHNYKGDRLLPVLLKDVAGLVPGACEGKGRGNRFLNDLCDADVLIHIVDVSGNTNEKGEQTSGYDPCLDIVWLKEEIHRWIFDNLMAKWDTIKRRPLKLIDMFTGYHASQATIHYVLHCAGIGDSELSNIANWKDDTVHRIVNQFISIRFPIYLALNKADVASSQENIINVKEKFPDNPCLPVSSFSETFLQQLNRDGAIKYLYGSDQIEKLSTCSSDNIKKIEAVIADIFERYGSSNVHQVLSEAVALKSPTYAFPVSDLDTLISIDKYKGQDPGILRDCVILKPLTTCEELYTVMLHYPVMLAAGDFVRAECRTDDAEKRIMKKSEVIGDKNTYNRTILKIMTTRKVTPCKRR